MLTRSYCKCLKWAYLEERESGGKFYTCVMVMAVDKRETFINDSKWIVQDLTDCLNNFNFIQLD